MCTIHQPSAKVFALFDTLLLLSAGEAAYFGPRQGALPFFDKLGFPCPVKESGGALHGKTNSLTRANTNSLITPPPHPPHTRRPRRTGTPWNT
jgi:hypothetical protein